MKSKSFISIFFISLGLLGLILFVFGLQFNGTLSEEIQLTGLAGMGFFAVWAIINLIDAYLKQKELENL